MAFSPSVASLATTPPQNAWVDAADPEWHAMWRALHRLAGDYADENAVNGEVWQYMGSLHAYGAWCHEFRHRDRPATANRSRLLRIGRTVAHVNATAGWTPAQAMVAGKGGAA